MRVFLVCGLLFLLGTGEVHAQVSGPVVQPVPGPPHHGRIDLATGRITRDSDDKTVSLVITWANTDYTGYYIFSGTSGIEEWLDWGVLSTSSGSEIVGEFQFAYATTVLDTSAGGPGASTCVSFYNDATGWCAESGQGTLPDASYCFSGLGGSLDGVTPTAWVYNVNLAGGAEFEQDLGPFGYSLVLLDTKTGPLCCYAGTINGGPDADGQEDAVDEYRPDVATGTCWTRWTGWPNNLWGWWLSIAQADGNGGTQASSTFRCGSGVNANTFTITSDPVLGGTFAGSVAATGGNVGAFLAAFSTPLTLTTSWGEILVNIADPGGELLGLPSALGDPAVIALPVPIDLTLCGALLSVQAVGFGGGITLTCAYDCTVGF
ncbi:MAG: hypothetical protein AB1793_09675 [Candidatus Thermoplasmatota archaeon]